MEKVINCKEIAESIYKRIELNPGEATLAVLCCTDDLASAVYMKNKEKACARLNYGFIKYSFSPKTVSYNKVKDCIDKLNADPEVSGIIIQMPFEGLTKEQLNRLVNLIDSVKDVDGFTDKNKTLLRNHTSTEFKHIPCTAKAVMDVIQARRLQTEENNYTNGKTALVIGRSDIVGNPVTELLKQANCTTIQANSHTSEEKLKELCKVSDIIVSCAGVKNLVGLDCLWNENVDLFIDVSINRDENNKLVGDCDEYYKENYCRSYTSVPGGIGLLTVANLMNYLSNAYHELKRSEV